MNNESDEILSEADMVIYGLTGMILEINMLREGKVVEDVEELIGNGEYDKAQEKAVEIYRQFTRDMSKCEELKKKNEDEETEAKRAFQIYNLICNKIGLYEEAEKLEKQQEQIAKARKATKSNTLNMPIDKLNQKIWTLLKDEQGNVPGQISIKDFALNELLGIDVRNQEERSKTDSKGNEIERDILFGIDLSYEEEKNCNIIISKPLTAYDRRVHDAVSTLYDARNEYMSLTQIAEAMGNVGRPSAPMMEKIKDSIDKMAKAQIYVDQSADFSKYYTNETKFYKGQILAIEQAGITRNGQSITAYHLFREPFLTTFAKSRKQLTKIPKEVLESGKRQTESNLAIESYLLARIARMKDTKNKTSRKISFDTAFNSKNLHIPKKRHTRAINTVEGYLKHFVKVGWIASYKFVPNGVEIGLADQRVES